MNKELKVMGSKFNECVNINLTINYKHSSLKKSIKYIWSFVWGGDVGGLYISIGLG